MPPMLVVKLPNTGETAPDFELPDSTGALRRLSQRVLQEPIILVFFRGHW